MEKLCNHKTFLVPFLKNPQPLIIKKTMFTTKAKAGTSLITKLGESVLPKLTSASMSYYTVNKYEKNLKDPVAILKNPPLGKKKFRHSEMRRTKCDKTDCDKKICPPNKPCGLITEHKTIGNITHGTKNTPYGTAHNLDPIIDCSGNLKPQNGNFYHKSHDAHVNQEDSQGTTFLNQTHVIKEVKKYEDKS
jgi:hypothetical protein